MNKLFYSVDRRGFYQEGAKLELMLVDTSDRPFWNLPGWYSESELKQHLRELFPDGLSFHGWQYLLDRHDFINIGTPPIPYVNHATTVELIFEYVRRASYPKLPSRFQSYFAWESIEDAKSFQQDQQLIYQLECEQFCKADQKLLTTGVQNITTSLCAHKYWSGESTSEPRWEYLLAHPVTVVKRVE